MRNAALSTVYVRPTRPYVILRPQVVPEASTVRVLTTEWVDGERLDQVLSSL